MKNSLKLTALIVFSMLAIPMHAADLATIQAASETLQEAISVKPLELVNNPKSFLYKDIKIMAEFDKFTTLGLDYNRALKSSKDYISILIRRPNIPDGHVIPLSELKIMLKRDVAEELMDLESGDRVEIVGKVFSAALNDPWVEVAEIKNLDPEKKEKDEDNEEKDPKI